MDSAGLLSAPAWLAETLAEWRPRPRVGGAEWAERERRLSHDESSDPGPFRCIPWQREILDALADVLITWLVILKAAQMGVSELVRCAVGRWALCDPGDVLWVLATEEEAKKAMAKLVALFENTPCLRPLLSPHAHDSKTSQLTLTNGMRIVIGWSGSAASLASHPYRYVILDEVGQYRTSVQGQASAVDFIRERVKTFGARHKIVLLSSPKSDSDLISQSFAEVQDRRVFAVSCSNCSTVQPIDFVQQGRWKGGTTKAPPMDSRERNRLADEIEREQSAWAACTKCDGPIQPHSAQWGPNATWVLEPGTVTEGPSSRRAYHVPELYHWKTTFSGLASKFLRCVTASAVQGFHNGSLGRAYRLEESLLEEAIFSSRAVHPPRLVPSWANTVIATADTQLDGWWYMVRAWGRGSRSRLLDWGFARTEAELLAACSDVRFPVEGEPGAYASPFVLAIDSGGGMERADGSRTRDVYEIVRRTRRAYAIKGESDREALQGPPWRSSRVRVGEKTEIDLHLLNRTFYADELVGLVLADKPQLWEECRGAEHRTYTSQMASERKVFVRSATGERWLWEKRAKGAANHMWDLARYQVWAADFARVADRSSPTWVRASASRTEDDREREEREPWIVGRGDGR